MPSLPRAYSAADAQTARIVTHITLALGLILVPGSVFEIRALGVTDRGRERWPYTLVGYFNDCQRAAEVVAREQAIRSATGWYFTLNPCESALQARASNRLKTADKGDGAKDHEILRRAWLPLDLDPIRPRGVSSTDAQHNSALSLARQMRATLAGRGWPDPIAADSGNGAHLLYPLDLPNNDNATDQVRRAIEGLAREFDTDTVKLDRNVFNAARIWKLPGTLARKGDDTPDRPHRWARLLDEGGAP